MEPHEDETLHEQGLRAARVLRGVLGEFTPEEQAIIATFLDHVTEPEGPAA